jgi:N-acetylmuramoyl-L-alanine amidase
MVKIAGCAGHGSYKSLNPKVYSTSGKRTPDGEPEWEFNNKVITAFEETLKQYENVEFLRTDDRTGCTDIPLTTRTSKANNWGADLYISFHENANSGNWGSWGGTETFSYGSGKSLEIAKVVHAAQLSAYGLRDRGLKDGKHLHIIKATKANSVLLEGAFMDSTTDISKLRDNNVLRKAGENVAHAVAKYYGLKKKVVNTPTQPKQSPAPTKPKEENDMLEKAVVIFGEADYATGNRLAAKLSNGGEPVGVYTRAVATGKRFAKELYVVGGDATGMIADKVVLLSGNDFYDTVAAVSKFVKGK